MEAKKDESVQWTQQDDAENNRLSSEMTDDTKLQFSLFTFGITTSTVVIGILASVAGTDKTLIFSNIPFGAFFLSPLIVLIPTSLVILNKARTRNRKAAYIIVNFDYKRLLSEGFTSSASLTEIRTYPFLPWETALHILQRTNPDKGKYVHLAPALKYMAVCYLVIEILCIFLGIYTSWQANPDLIIWIAIGGILIYLLITWHRATNLLQLKGKFSIQGYVEQWLDLKSTKKPAYLHEWIKEFKNRESLIKKLLLIIMVPKNDHSRLTPRNV